ncbi:uncharacterized protein LOC113329910 [Papaver somniferum]|uniref:uncharacterized protein LOC113329910 n=1 Tax=Papaver somniferum TaxID=3469 RepID=UPI000E6FF1D5|nr:uncharacterized protein LOC113329910 [Papaver somniferum]
MDKSWMQKGRCHPDYFRGCEEFINFAWSHRTPDLGESIFCPCLRYNNVNCLGRDVVREHIRENGIIHSYTCWTKHGEPEELVNNIGEEVTNVIGEGDMHGMLQAAFPESRFFAGDGEFPDQANTNGSSQHDRVPDEPHVEAQKFYKLLKDAERPLFPGCTTSSKLSHNGHTTSQHDNTGYNGHGLDIPPVHKVPNASGNWDNQRRYFRR